jgi:hypothetical protein
MPAQAKRSRLPSALKHAGYSTTALLPGESRSKFDKLRRDLIKELRPDGPLEHDIVLTLARLVWRWQHLDTLRKAKLAQESVLSMNKEISRSIVDKVMNEYRGLNEQPEKEPEKEEDLARDSVSEEWRNYQACLKEKIGNNVDLVKMGEDATVDCLMYELDVQDRLGAMIDKCLKRLMLVKGLKSVLPGPSSPKGLPAP